MLSKKLHKTLPWLKTNLDSSEEVVASELEADSTELELLGPLSSTNQLEVVVLPMEQQVREDLCLELRLLPREATHSKLA